jgi:hypothetical protein
MLDPIYRITLAIEELRQARDHLRQAKANRAAVYVARALKSAEGALLHATNKELSASGLGESNQTGNRV